MLLIDLVTVLKCKNLSPLLEKTMKTQDENSDLSEGLLSKGLLSKVHICTLEKSICGLLAI